MNQQPKTNTDVVPQRWLQCIFTMYPKFWLNFLRIGMSSKQFCWGMSEQKKLDMPFFWQIPFAASYICARRNFSCFCHPHIILTNFLALLTRNTMGKFNKGDFHDSMKIFTYVHYNKGQSSLMRSKKNSTKHGIYIHLFFADTLRSAKYLNT